MPARQLCPKVNLKIRGVDFVVNLIVLESKGIDVILGMDWLSNWSLSQSRWSLPKVLSIVRR
jgi:hypothetical protein